MDKESITKLGLSTKSLDIDKSYEIYEESSSTNIIHLFFLPKTKKSCPMCHSNDFRIRGSKIISLKSASLLQYKITVKLHLRVFKCNVCGRVFKEDNPYSYNSHTLSFNKYMLIIDALRNPTETFKSIATQFGVSVTKVMNIFDTYVDINQHDFPEVISFDEVYTRKFAKNKYCFILYSPMNSKIIDIVNSRHKLDLIQYFCETPMEYIKNVRYVSIDLYNNYRIIAKKVFFSPIICADPFHVIKNISQAFNAIRISVMNKYKDYKGENSHRYWLLKKFWKLILMDSSKLSYERFKIRKLDMWLSPKEIVFEILKTDPILEKAYDLLNDYRNFNSTYTYEECEEKLDEFIHDFLSFPSEKYNTIGNMLKNWRQEIINSFIRYEGKRITNGFIERKNKDIKTIIRMANGYRNFARFRNRVMFSLNKNEPILAVPKKNTNKIKYKKRGKYKK